MELTLAPLSNEPVTIRKNSKVWTATVDLSTADAMLYRRMTDMTDVEVFGRLVDLVHRALQPNHPDLTPAQVESTFGPIDLAQIYNCFLTQAGLRLSAPVPAKATPKRRKATSKS